MVLATSRRTAQAAPRQSRILAQIMLSVYGVLGAQAAQRTGAGTRRPTHRRQPYRRRPRKAVNYTVRIDAPGKLDDLLEDNLDLLRWRGNPRVDLDQLQRLVKAVPEEAKTLIATEGYYSPKITAGLDTSGGTPVARIVVDPGQPTLVSDLDLVLQGFVPFEQGGAPYDSAALRRRWTLPVGARFRQGDWEAAKRDLLREVMQSRFPRAQLVETSATVDPDAYKASLRVVIDSGPEMRFGALRIRGLKRYPQSVITNLNKIKPGDMYTEAALQALQARLQETGYFATVEVSADMRAVLAAELKELKEDDEDTPPGRADAGSARRCRRRPGHERRQAAHRPRPDRAAGAGARHREQAEEPRGRRRLLDQYGRPRFAQLRRLVRVRQAHEERPDLRTEAPAGACRLLLADHARKATTTASAAASSAPTCAANWSRRPA